MNSLHRYYLLFTTDLFVYEQPDEDIDQWFVGGDCCGWFYMRLLLHQGIDICLPPVMEDWGWTFAVTANRIPVSIYTWSYDQIENCWLMGLHARNRRVLRRYSKRDRAIAQDLVADAMDSVVRSDNRFTRSLWTSENPFDTGLEAFPVEE